MNKFWRIMAHEYTRHVDETKTFFWPAQYPDHHRGDHGYLDHGVGDDHQQYPGGITSTHSGLLVNPIFPPPANDPFTKPVQLIAYPSEFDAPKCTG